MEQPNLSYINQLSNGDEGFKQQLIEVVKSEFPDEKAIYIENFTAKNFKKAAENVHKLKHKISILGLQESYKIAANYEENLKQENEDLSDEFLAILQNITDYLKTL